MSIVEEVDTILKVKSVLSSDFGLFSKIYLMTTENIKAFLQQYSLQNKDILTVAGSGDQMLNAYLMGANNVTCFDINPLAFCQVKLKKAAVCSLEYEEFLEFFFPEFGKLFERCLFDKFSYQLDSETKALFQYLYSNYESKDILNKIYYSYHASLEKMKSMNAYLDKDNYQKLASILKGKNVNFIQSDITGLRSKLEENIYDMILLSNISDSIEDIYPIASLKNFKRLIHSLSKNLHQDGIIQVGYIYDYFFTRHDRLFSKKQERQKVFTTDEFLTTLIESYRFHSESDAVITFQKKRKKLID